MNCFPSNAHLFDARTGVSFFVTVEIYSRMQKDQSAPTILRNVPEFFYFYHTEIHHPRTRHLACDGALVFLRSTPSTGISSTPLVHHQAPALCISDREPGFGDPDTIPGTYGLNPIVSVINGFRWALLGAKPPDEMMFVSIGMIVVLLIGVCST
jgi:hypothetical protein